MKTVNTLEDILKGIDGRGYKDIVGTYDFSDFMLTVDHVQGDPFAALSRRRITSRKPLLTDGRRKAVTPLAYSKKEYRFQRASTRTGEGTA
jgi:predicted ABC-class ATPase